MFARRAICGRAVRLVLVALAALDEAPRADRHLSCRVRLSRCLFDARFTSLRRPSVRRRFAGEKDPLSVAPDPCPTWYGFNLGHKPDVSGFLFLSDPTAGPVRPGQSFLSSDGMVGRDP